MTIFLVGSMGVGKTSIGKRMAAQLKIPFFDTDDIIVEQEGKSINEIFSLHGEAYFRTLESKVLRAINVTKKQVIATGGGLPMADDNMDLSLIHI